MKTRLDINASPGLRRLLKHCEIYCTADCCKENAFDMTPNTIRVWQDWEPFDRIGDIANELNELRNQNYNEFKEIHIVARGLESQWQPHEIQNFFQELYEQFVKAKNKNLESNV